MWFTISTFILNSQKNTPAEKQAPVQAKAKPKGPAIKKKGLKGPRARVGERAASAAAKNKAERDKAAAEASKEAEKVAADKVKETKASVCLYTGKLLFHQLPARHSDYIGTGQ